jgi:hypothetical protein
MAFKQCESCDWIHLAQVRDQCWAPVNTVMTSSFAERYGFLTGLTWTWTPLHGVTSYCLKGILAWQHGI